MLPLFIRQTRTYLGHIKRFFDPRFTLSYRRLLAYQNLHAGKRCFIIGNGPSLQKMDLAPLKNEISFGTNRIYLLFNRMGFLPTYYVSVNHLVIQQCAEEIITHVPVPKFMDWDARSLIKFTDDMVFLKSFHEEPRFFNDISQGIWQGMTVTYVAMQIAYYMGFKQVILIGVDHSFSTRGKPHDIVTSAGDDPDHFDKTYFGRGFRWQIPDLEGSEVAYRMAGYHYKRDGREILDATVDGKLNVFPKINFSSLF